jgi:pyrimidine operon attenuation protein/uracil phosphoribosyltransferase
MEQSTTIMTSEDIARTIKRLAHEILERNKGLEDIVLLGVVTRGVALANRLSEQIKEIEGADVSHGQIDITLYRDDYTTNIKPPSTVTNFPSIHNKTVVIVDDVLYTGRTIRASLDLIMEYGRPNKVQLVTLVDRGHRELPIKADYIGKNIPTAENEKVKVSLSEYDGKDEVTLIKQTI